MNSYDSGRKEMINSSQSYEDRFLLFNIEEKKYALSLQFIERVIHAVAITQVSEKPGLISGMINMEGEFLSVINLRRCLNIITREIKTGDRLIIIHRCNKRFAFLVDSVIDLIKADLDDLTEESAGFGDSDFITGVIKQDAAIIPVLGTDYFYSILTGDYSDSEVSKV